MHIGLYFGSFNPIHIGHLIIASYARHTTDLQQVWLVVSPQNPLKSSNSLLNEYDRLHLIHKAIEKDPDLKVTDIEFKLSKPSYTVHTLAHLSEKYPKHKFSIILGSDSFMNLTKWKNYEYIVKHHHLFIFRRPGFEVHNTIGAQITLIDAPLLEISSTRIREMIRASIPVRYLVPDSVADEIEANRYYK
ncbi:MAG TPA: nicotinate (nicotinamide) nucleotide adenylyltransferase [Phnomibacter sp.]|nr:nicotinate (nicotinamide) nucleotide adenylyltransferase [Phnomibacter sp.]